MMIQFRKFVDRDDIVLYASPELINTNSTCTTWPYRLIIKLEYPRDWDSTAQRDHGNYYVSVLAVSPVAAQSVLDDACVSQGYTRENGYYIHDGERNLTDLAYYEVLVGYGVCAHLWSNSGNNLEKLLRQARIAATTLIGDIDTWINKPQNACGTPAIDWITKGY